MRDVFGRRSVADESDALARKELRKLEEAAGIRQPVSEGEFVDVDSYGRGERTRRIFGIDIGPNSPRAIRRSLPHSMRRKSFSTSFFKSFSEGRSFPRLDLSSESSPSGLRREV